MKTIILYLLASFLITGCSDTDETRIFTEQEAALGKAKEVEGKILDAANAQRQTINEDADGQ